MVVHDDEASSTRIPFDTLVKAGAVRRWLDLHLAGRVAIVRPERVTTPELARTHSRAYLAALQRGVPEHLAASNGLGWDDGLWNSVVVSTSAVRTAALVAWQRGTVTGASSSGLHHARRGEGAGYCTLNGLVVAARAVLAAGAVRVLVLDLDAHCGGGTASLIDGVPGIEQVDVSVVSFDSYEPRDDARLWLVDADEYLPTVQAALESVVDPTTVDLVLYNAGMDPHEDAGGVTGIDSDMLRVRDRMVMEWAEEHGLPLAFVLAGGYAVGGRSIDEVAALHGITFEEAVRSVAGRASAN